MKRALLPGSKIGLGVILALFALYAAAFIFRSSVLVSSNGLTKRAYVLFDDAMISMRYAHNFAAGKGLTWNPGERAVEGYTNPGWVLLMAVAHQFPIDALKISLLIQLAGALFLLGNILATYALARRVAPGHLGIALSATILTAWYYPLNYWGLTGMEVSLCVLIVTSALLLVLGNCELIALFTLAAATWIRLDLAVVFFAVWVFCLLFRARKRPVIVFAPLLYIMLALGSQTAWRLWYYGELLPNTYYLKMTGFPAGLRVLRGAVHFVYFVVRSAWPLLVVAIVALIVHRKKFQKLNFHSLTGPLKFTPQSQAVGLLGLCVLAQGSYSIYVGGDAWERLIACNRFVGVVVPAFFILYAYALWHVCLSVFHRHNSIIYGASVVLSLLNFNSFPRQDSLAQWVHYRQPEFTDANRENLQFAIELPKVLRSNAVLAVDAAGVVPYFINNRCIDLLGKCDYHVARQPMHRGVMTQNPLLEFYPGHLKWDYAYSIGQLKPDAVMSRWGRARDNSPDYLDPDYLSVKIAGVETWLRKDSPNVVLLSQ